MDHDLLQKLVNYVTQGKYCQCFTVFATVQCDKDGAGEEWMKCNNTLVCKLKCSKECLPSLQKQYENLLQQVKGVFLSDDLVNLLAVATHNLCHIHLMAGIFHPNMMPGHGSTRVEDSLRETMKCICDHYGVTVAEESLTSLTSAVIEVTRKHSDIDHRGLYLLLYSCALVCVLRSDCKQAKTLVSFLKDRLKRLDSGNDNKQDLTPFLLCHSDEYTRNSFPFVLLNLCGDLSIITHFLSQEWDHCLQSIAHCEENQQSIHMEFRYMKCWLYFTNKRFDECMKYADGQIKTFGQSNKDVTARFLNIVGCCLSCQGKFHSAIQKFQKALRTDFKCLVPLYNISLQYRHLRLFNAELECLNLLLSALNNNSTTQAEMSHHSLKIPCFLVKGLEFLSGEISERQVLYLLAKRCYQLQRYDKGSEKYKELLKLLTSENTRHQHPVTSHLPEISLHQVYKEAAFCLLSAGQYQECVNICDRFLQVKHSNSITLSSCQSNIAALPDQSEDEEEEDFFGLLIDEKMALELKEMKQSQQISQQYNRSESLDADWHESIAAILYYKADALAHTGLVSEAIKCLNELTETLENEQGRLVEQSRIKRQKVEDAMDTDSDKSLINQDESLELLQSAYLNKSLLLMAEKKYTQVLQVSRLSLQLQPGCEASLYVHILALFKLDRQREGCHTWLSHRKLEVRGDSLHVQHLLKKREELLKAAEAQSGDTTQAKTLVNSITTVEFLKLDIQCITYIRDRRWPAR